MKPFFFSLIILLCFTLFQIAVLSNIYILPVVPDLLLICVLYLSVQNGRLFGVASGFCSGLFLDFLSTGPFGFHCLLRTIIGYFFGFFNKTLNISGFVFPFILGLASTVLKFLLIWLICVFYTNLDISVNFFSVNFLKEMIFNAVLVPIMFKFMNIFSNSIVLTPEKVN